MFAYEKRLQFPVKIKNTNPDTARLIMSQYGGPDGELGAALRYLSQRYSMPSDELKGLLTDVGTEELAHFEMIGAMIYQLTRNLSCDEIKKQGFDAYFVTDFCGGVVLREEFTLEEGLAEMSLEKYITNVTPIFCIFITNPHQTGIILFYVSK